MAKVHQLKTTPKKIRRPCDYGLSCVVTNMEMQVGTVEAHNKLCDAAIALKAQIDAGNAKQALKMFAIDPEFIYPHPMAGET